MESTISSLVIAAEGGDPSAAAALFAALYSELHGLARRQLARNAPELTLGTTSLLHEAYLDIANREGTAFPDRGRFMAYAARVMRSLIIDRMRHRQAQKRGGRFEITSLTANVADPALETASLERIGEALDELAAEEPLLAQVVDLKYFCGFSLVEIAAMHEVSERTVQRQWEKARIFLHGVLGDAASL